MNTKVFFSRHEASSLMLEHLSELYGEGKLEQFKGTFSEFKGNEEGISFVEIVGSPN